MSYRPKWWLDFLRIVWPLTLLSAKMTRWPVVGPLVALLARPVMTGKNFHITHIPINATIKGRGSTMLPEKVLEELIRRSSHRITINRCTCRESEKCRHYPIEDACLHLGEGTIHIDRHLATPRTVDEAIAHMRKMIGLGLIPFLGRVRMDDFFYGRPNTGRALTICFCCPCCCTIFKSTRYYPDNVKESLVRLKGLRIVINDTRCTGDTCGVCIDECFTGALSFGPEGVVWNGALCKGCGRCATVCPQKAVTVDINSIDDAIDDIMGRMKEIIDIE
jgi:ferredoxin